LFRRDVGALNLEGLLLRAGLALTWVVLWFLVPQPAGRLVA